MATVDSTPSPADQPAESGTDAVEGTDRDADRGTDGNSLTPSLVVVVLVATVAITGALWVLLRGSDEPTGPVAIDSLPFTTSDGSTATLADYEGKPLVVNFFASWCAPCKAEMPDLEEVHQAAGGEVAFLGVNNDFDETSWRSMVEETGVTFPTVFQPDQEIYQALELVGMPSTALIDAEGEVVHVTTGAVTADSLRELVATHLGIEL